MLARIKSTIQQSFIYSLSNVAAKAAGIVLLPIFLHQLTVEQFGVWDLLDTSIQILAEIVILGQASAIIFLNNSDEFRDRKKSSLFTISIFMFLFSFSLILACELINKLFPSIFNGSIIQFNYLRLAAYVVLLRVMNNLFFAKVRAEEEAKYFTVVNIFRIVLIVLFTVYFVTVLGYGILGGLYSFIITEIFILVVLLFKVLPQMKNAFDNKLLKVALKFGLPLVFGSIGFMLLNLSDRYIIKWLLGAKYVALYGLGYRIAGVLNMFLILPFNLGLIPIAYKYFGKQNDLRFYSKLMTYSTFMFVWGFVALSLFSPEVIILFAGRGNYETSFIVIPIILLSYVFSGMRLTAQLGMLLTKNTKHIAWITIGAALFNIILNLIFIPIFGIIAAALNTLISFIFFYYITQFMSNKYFKIPFENGKLLLMLLVGSLISSAVYLIGEITFTNVLIKVLLVLIFPIILFVFRFYEKAELDILLSGERLISFVKDLFKNTEKVEQEKVVD